MAAQAALASVFEPARNALVPELVGVEEVTGANGLMSVNGSVARLAGGWAGGALLGFGGLADVITGYLAVLVVAAALLAKPFRRVSAPAPAVGPEPVVRAWLDGLRELTHNRRLWRTGLALAFTSLAQGMFLVLFVVYVLDVLGGSEADAGLLRGVQAIGGPGRRVRAGHGGAAGGAGGVARLGVDRAGPAVGGDLEPGLVTTALGCTWGCSCWSARPGVVVGAGVLSEIQSAVAPERAGRVLSTTFAAMATFTTVGALLAGRWSRRRDRRYCWTSRRGSTSSPECSCGPGTAGFAKIPASSMVTVEGCRTSSPPATST